MIERLGAPTHPPSDLKNLGARLYMHCLLLTSPVLGMNDDAEEDAEEELNQEGSSKGNCERNKLLSLAALVWLITWTPAREQGGQTNLPGTRAGPGTQKMKDRDRGPRQGTEIRQLP